MIWVHYPGTNSRSSLSDFHIVHPASPPPPNTHMHMRKQPHYLDGKIAQEGKYFLCKNKDVSLDSQILHKKPRLLMLIWPLDWKPEISKSPKLLSQKVSVKRLGQFCTEWETESQKLRCRSNWRCQSMASTCYMAECTHICSCISLHPSISVSDSLSPIPHLIFSHTQKMKKREGKKHTSELEFKNNFLFVESLNSYLNHLKLIENELVSRVR